MTDGPPLWTAALTRRRDLLNERIAVAVSSGADPQLLRESLRHIGFAVAHHLDGMPPARLDGWVTAVVDTVCREVSRGTWGPRSLAAWAVQEIALRLARHTDEPGPVLADLLRAADRVWRSGDVALWGRLLVAAAQAEGEADATAGSRLLDAARLRELGVVAAWRAGDVRFRDAGLRLAGRLEPAVAAAVLALPPGTDADQVLQANRAAPQRWPGVGPRLVGGLRVLGGCFARPPVLRAGDGLRWLLLDGPAPVLVTVDAHGWRSDPGDSPAAGRLPEVVPQPSTGRRWAAHRVGDGWVGTSPTSFHLLVGAPPGAA